MQNNLEIQTRIKYTDTERTRETEREREIHLAVSPGVWCFVYTPIWVIQLSGTTDFDVEPLIPFDSSNCLGCIQHFFYYIFVYFFLDYVCVCDFVCCVL